MKLIIVRHGEADQSASDAARELTPAGRTDVARMAALIGRTGWTVTEIVTSPLVRARQTAAIISETIGGPQVDVALWLEPGIDPEGCLGEIDSRDANAAMVWVFHAPDVQRLGAILLGLSESAFYFPPGAMLALNLPVPRPRGRAMLVWNLHPALLE